LRAGARDAVRARAAQATPPASVKVGQAGGGLAEQELAAVELARVGVPAGGAREPDAPVCRVDRRADRDQDRRAERTERGRARALDEHRAAHGGEGIRRRRRPRLRLSSGRPDTVTLRDAAGRSLYSAPVEPLTGLPTVPGGKAGQRTAVLTGIRGGPHAMP